MLSKFAQLLKQPLIYQLRLVGETPLFRFKLHEVAFACAAFRLELTDLLEEEARAAEKVKPPPQPEPIRGERNEPTQQPAGNQPSNKNPLR